MIGSIDGSRQVKCDVVDLVMVDTDITLGWRMLSGIF